MLESEATVQSILAQSTPPDEVIVIVNNTTDNTAEVAESAGATGIMGMSFEQFSMVGMGLLTVGAAMTAAKFAPRVAIEPRYDLAKGKQRMVLTLNGHPVRRRNTKL